MAKDRIDFTIETSSSNPNDIQYEMWIQGKRIAIPKDKEVAVNPIVKDLYKECQALAKKANKGNRKLVVFEDDND